MQFAPMKAIEKVHMDNDMMDAILYRARQVAPVIKPELPHLAQGTRNDLGYKEVAPVEIERADACAHWPKWKRQLFNLPDMEEFDRGMRGKNIIQIYRGDRFDCEPLMIQADRHIYIDKPINWGQIVLPDWAGMILGHGRRGLKDREHGPEWMPERLMCNQPQWYPHLLMCDYPRYRPEYHEYGPRYNPWYVIPLVNEGQRTPTAIAPNKFIVYRLEKDGYGPCRHPREGFQLGGRKMNQAYHESNLTNHLSRVENENCTEFFQKARKHGADVRYACPTVEALIEYWSRNFYERALEAGFEVKAYEVEIEGEPLVCGNGWQVAYPVQKAREYAQAA